MPDSFKDSNGREWFLTVTIPRAREIRDALGVDVLNTQEALPKISASPIMFVDVLWLLVKDQAEKRGLSDVDFGESLIGQALGDATDAFVGALITFSPPRKQKILRAMQSTGQELEKMLAGMAETKIPEALKAVRDLTSGQPSAGSQGSSGMSPEAHSES